MEKIRMKLTRPAKKAGGDRYEGMIAGQELVVYFPQAISRTEGNGVAKEEIVLIVTPVGKEEV